MIPAWLLALLVVGANVTFWSTAGVLRLLEDRLRLVHRTVSGRHRPRAGAVGRDEVAVLMAAHNEEPVLADSLAAITASLPPRQVHVISDGSTDRTEEIAESAGVRIARTPANIGKARALCYGIEHFGLIEGYSVVLLLDADSRLTPSYFERALPLFDDPEIVVVACCARTEWSATPRTPLAQLLTAHRARVYSLLQRLMKFGQAWRHANAISIAPGFASMYRTKVLPYLEIDAPGLVIEDFNMTFEVHRNRLGRIAFVLDAVATTQDPNRFGEYVRQTHRWALGFWQAVRRYRPRPDVFSFALAAYLFELVLSGVLLCAAPLLAVLSFLLPPVAAVLPPETIGIGVLAPDVALTVFVTCAERRFRYLLWAPLYLPLRMLDAALALAAAPRAWLRTSDGRWRSPTRTAFHPRENATRAALGSSAPEP
ncbi:glycosyltransferase [Sciscionella sediminilitoris]|uniref:glycosyltransferase n=1 Tax=Sciscionella sediminilitoris TaxID=1445613 RepID=UPI0006911E60|nr:glycosyltransferase family 2 protein [Sciscionella sp. SE31]